VEAARDQQRAEAVGEEDGVADGAERGEGAAEAERAGVMLRKTRGAAS
jgi:hypothetical protein